MAIDKFEKGKLKPNFTGKKRAHEIVRPNDYEGITRSALKRLEREREKLVLNLDLKFGERMEIKVQLRLIRQREKEIKHMRSRLDRMNGIAKDDFNKANSNDFSKSR